VNGKMRVVFLGTPTFALPALQSLVDHSYEICAVFTQPDRPSGRGHKLKPSPVKSLARTLGIPIFQPEKIKDQQNRNIFEKLQPDFVVVAAYGQILPAWLLECSRFGAINIHASLLPRYRGAAPIPWAILNGEVITGVTTMIMEEALDSGPILLQKAIPIPITKTAGELSEVLSKVGAGLLIQTLDGMKKNALAPIQQDKSQISWAPRIMKEMARISWEKRALDVHNQIRAMNPWPVAYTSFRDERLQILRSLPEEGISDLSKKHGVFLGLTRNGLRVQCGEGTVLELLEMQMPGRSRVSGREFASGMRLNLGEFL
jgi:methionyl-tRNA formyltransferase